MFYISSVLSWLYSQTKGFSALLTSDSAGIVDLNSFNEYVRLFLHGNKQLVTNDATIKLTDQCDRDGD